MAPEMASGPLTRIGVRSDVYLLGAVLFEIITGIPPHPGRDAMNCIRNAAANVIQPVRESHSGKLMDIAEKALATQTSDRYANVLEFQQAIRDFLAHSESIKVSQRAEERLALARQTDEYEDFAQAQFGFQQALEMWSGNALAEVGFEQARLAYAECALAKEDFDLGLSLLDFSQPAHAKLIRSLSAGRARSDSTPESLAFAASDRTADGRGHSGRRRLVFSQPLHQPRIRSGIRGEGQSQCGRREGASRAGQPRSARATEQADRANRQTVLAKEQAERTGKEALRANEEAERALRSDYRKTIGLVSQRILENEFTQAEQLLSEARSKRRHFEWGRLQVHHSSWYRLHHLRGREVRADSASCDLGRWRPGYRRPRHGSRVSWKSNRPDNVWLRLQHDRLPHDQLMDVAVSPDGQWAATAGGDAESWRGEALETRRTCDRR